MDTKEFKDLSPEEYKKQTQANWTKAPCGSSYSDKEFMSKEFFEEVEQHRYTEQDWTLDNISRFDINGKKVLEIGFGMGTDHLAMARKGGIMHGIDLTPKNREVASKRFEIYGYQSELITGDAEHLPYEDNTFDFVYSFGVIHHSPDTQRIIDEIHRVLKPGGKCWITVYHRNSLFFWWSVFFCDWILRGGFLRETLKQRISRVEYPNDNPNLVIRLYKENEFADMFSGFSRVKSSIDHLIRSNVFFLGRFIPDSLLRPLAKKFGWYVIVEAEK